MRYVIVPILLIGSMAYLGGNIPDYLEGIQPPAENYESGIQDQATELIPINIMPTMVGVEQPVPSDTYNEGYFYHFYPRRIVRDKKLSAL